MAIAGSDMRRIFLLIFFLFSCQTAISQTVDLRLLEYINGPVAQSDQTWKKISFSLNIVMVAAPASMLITGFATNDRVLVIKGLETTGSIAIAGIAQFGLKAAFRRARPYLAYPDLIVGKTNAGGFSFPSGHATVAFALATSLSRSFPHWYVIVPSFAYASVVSYSRLYLGAHYPSDVFAGALVGVGSSYLSWELQKLLDKKSRNSNQRLGEPKFNTDYLYKQ